MAGGPKSTNYYIYNPFKPESFLNQTISMIPRRFDLVQYFIYVKIKLYSIKVSGIIDLIVNSDNSLLMWRIHVEGNYNQ